MKQDINNRLGLIWILISVFFASIMAISVKELGQIFDSRLLVLFRAFLLTIFLVIPILFIPNIRSQLKFSKPKLHIFRGILIAVSTHLGFYTLTKLPIATTTVLFLLPQFSQQFCQFILIKKKLVIVDGLQSW